MRVGIPRETAAGEGRVAATPSAVRALVDRGHVVCVEQGAGVASGFADDDYLHAQAELLPTAEDVWDRAERVWKVAAPSEHERTLLRPGQSVAALFHGSPLPPTGVEAIRLEAWSPSGGDAPVRVAMSEIAGRLAVEAASFALQRAHGGRGILLGGVPGVPPAEVAVLGAGVAGAVAARFAAATGAAVTVLDLDVARLRALPGLRTALATPAAIERALALSDVVIAAVRAPSGPAPRVATRAHLALMQPGAVVVDLSILDGGAFATTPTTSLDAPLAVVDDIVFIGVPNFPGGVPRTSSPALSAAALPAILASLG